MADEESPEESEKKIDSLSHPEVMALFAVVVIQNATVHHLKKAIQRHILLKLSREGVDKESNDVKKYIWKTYWLSFEGQKLTENHQPLT
ncbi:hypothetical protein pdam_00024625, partial [Pocillopora damicornis]